ncbi:MAG: S-layer homology domain-containing protein, partial [Clostridia bacterium]|nr:S-layer homology domain-containing protein [Clostridia bacterium]
MLKRSLSLLIAAAFLIALIPAAASSEPLTMDFKDVPKTEWYYEYVRYVYENGLMVGTSPTKFEPESSLTRGMFVTILCRIDGGTPEATDKFKDVPANEWYAPYVGWASKTGLVNGYPGGLFKPEANLSRQEMAAITDRYIAYRGINMPRRFTAPSEFADSARIEDWAKGNMENLRRAGIFNGDNAGKCNPTANITRAETATVVKNLLDAQALAWQGYDPVGDEGPVILGAKYLYENASQIRGTLGTEIDLSGEVPTLDAYYDSYRAGYTSDFHYAGFYGAKCRMNSVGVSVTGIKLDIDKYPVMKVAYTYVDYDEPETLDGSYQHNFEEEYGTNHAHRDPFSFVKGENDGDFKTATFDFSDKFSADTFDWDYDVLNLLVCPFDVDYRGVLDGLPNGKFRIAYIGFFPDQASADAFGLSTASDPIRDYISNYFLYTELDWREADDATIESYDTLLTNRVNEILNSKSEVTPADITKNGGKVYYLSSFRGDDKNDGLTPDTPWKSISNLWTYKTGTPMRKTILKAGDGVFFERGSIYYPERYGKSMILTLDVVDDVTYGAYGTGPKPQFTHALDFGAKRSDEDATGVWLPTEWENVWVLDDDVGFWEDGEDEDRGQE